MFVVVVVLCQVLSMTSARPNIFDFGSFFKFPEVRRGRAAAQSALHIQDQDKTSFVSVSKDGGDEANVIAKLIDAVMQEMSPRSFEK